MVDRVCTRFIDSDGFDVGCNFVTKEYVLDIYPELINEVKAPALWSWGSNIAGNLGDDTLTSKSSPIQTVSGGTNWKYVQSGGYVSAAIKTDGILWIWGNNNAGQLGNNSIINRSSPVQTVISGIWAEVSTNGVTTAAIRGETGIKGGATLWLWGNATNGITGNNSVVTRSSPVQTISSGTNWKRISLGSTHATALKTDNTLWLWGSSDRGQLGNNAITSRSSPVQTISGGTNWCAVNAGAAHTAAIKTDGTLWLWGYGFYGQLGTNTTATVSSPVQTVSGGTNWKAVSMGDCTTAAIKTDGTLWTWGHNAFGRLGDNSTIRRSSPVQTVSGGTNWFKVALGPTSVGAIKTDGSLWLWGRNLGGRLGDNTVVNRSSPVQTVNTSQDWRTVAVGSATLAIKDDGEY
jgi:alpha-tubulin suppressor-like RCC1 family protein